MAPSGEYAICPYCGALHGDCSEWLTSERPQSVTCDGCGQEFRAWAEYDVQYVTAKLVKDTPDA